MILTHPPAKIIAKFLMDQGVGTRPSGTLSSFPIYDDDLPSDIDKGMAIVDAGAFQDGRARSERIEHPVLLIYIRSKNPDEAWTKAKTVCDLFDNAHGTQVTIGSTTYVIAAITRTSPPVPLPTGDRLKEEKAKGRKAYTINMRCTINNG